MSVCGTYPIDQDSGQKGESERHGRLQTSPCPDWRYCTTSSGIAARPRSVSARSGRGPSLRRR
jgi:hypothetical protein